MPRTSLTPREEQQLEAAKKMPMPTKHLTKAIILKKVVEADGSPTKLGPMLGITPQAAKFQIHKPDAQKVLAIAREKALKKAGITRGAVFKVIGDGLKANVVATFEGQAIESDAPDYKERREAAKLGLQLIGELKEDENPGQVQPLVQIFLPQRKTLQELLDVDRVKVGASTPAELVP